MKVYLPTQRTKAIVSNGDSHERHEGMVAVKLVQRQIIAFGPIQAAMGKGFAPLLDGMTTMEHNPPYANVMH